jgi:hypothetical protein
MPARVLSGENTSQTTLGYRVEHFYFPCSGLIIALATNSSVNNNDDALFATAVSVYQTLEKAGAMHTG